MRIVLAACTAALVALSACTGSDTSGSPATRSSGTTPASAAPSGSTSAAPPPAQHVTTFTKAWTWQALPPDLTGLSPRSFEDAVVDGNRIVWAEVIRTNVLGIIGSRTTVASADLTSRKVVWSHTVKGEPKLLKVVGNTVVVHLTVGVGNGQGTSPLYGFDAATGEPVWHKTVGPGVAVLGTSLVLATKAAATVTTRRVDADTGRDLETYAGYPGPPIGAAGDRVVFAADGKLTAFDSALTGQTWSAGSASRAGVDEFVVGDAVVVAPSDKGAGTVTGYDLENGTQRWVHPVTFDSEVRDTEVVGDRIYLRTDSAMTSFGADGTMWTVPQSGAARVGAGPSGAANPIACGRALLSLSPDGGLYGYADLPTAQFANLECKVAPLVTDAGDIVVVGETGIVGYRTSSTDAAPTEADGFGRWGPLDPAACTAPFTIAMAKAFDRVLDPRWRLVAGGKKLCVWRNNHSFPVIESSRLASAAAAKAYLDPSNADGGCKVPGWTGGKAAVVPVAGKGLPAGSGICSLLGSSLRGEHQDDIFTGATHTKDGTWFAITLFYPYLKGADFAGGGETLSVLRALAG